MLISQLPSLETQPVSKWTWWFSTLLPCTCMFWFVVKLTLICYRKRDIVAKLCTLMPAGKRSFWESLYTLHAVFFLFIRNSNYFQAASFLIFRDFEPASFLISFLNSLSQFWDVILCWLKNHRLVWVTNLLGFIDVFLVFFLLLTGEWKFIIIF